MDKKNKTFTNYKNKKELAFNFHIILATLFFIVPMMPYLNYLLHGFMFSWFIFCLWLIVVFFDSKKFLSFLNLLRTRKITLFWLCLFIGIVAFNYLFIDTNYRSFRYLLSFINLLLIVTLDSYYSIQPKKYRRSILFYIIIGLGIQALISIPYFLTSSGNIARLLTSHQLNETLSVEAMKNGVGGNSHYLSLIVLLFLVASHMRAFKKFPQLIMIVGAIAMILSIFLSSFFTPIVMFIVALVILLIWYNKRFLNGRVILFGALLVGILVYFYNRFLTSTFLLRPIIKRAEGLIYGTGSSIEVRASLAKNSLNTFVNHPFFGVGILPRSSYEEIGGHNVWVDFLAYLGALGFLPFLIFLGILIKKNLPFYFSKTNNQLYRVSCFIGLFIFILSNSVTPTITSHIMLVFVFFYCLSFSNYINQENMKVNKNNWYEK